MVYAVVCQDVRPTHTVLLQRALKTADGGWLQISEDTWLIATQANQTDWKEFLLSEVPGIQVVILKLSGGWATTSSAQQDTANWLRSARGWF